MMTTKIKNALITEKIPAALCVAACIASIFMGFVLGHIFWGVGEPVYAHDDSAAVYQSTAPHLAVYPELYATPAPTQQPACGEPAAPDPEVSHLYVVTILDGYLAIYHAGGGLKEVTSTAVGNLDPDERERLVAGVKVYSDEALAMILQDYGS